MSQRPKDWALMLASGICWGLLAYCLIAMALVAHDPAYIPWPFG